MVDLKLEIGSCYNQLDDTKQLVKILTPLLDRHFGRLPIVFERLGDCLPAEKVLLLYKNVSSLLKSGNHSYEVIQMVKDRIGAVVVKALHDVGGDVQVAKEVMKENNVQFNSSCNAYIAMMEGNYEEALKIFTCQQEELSEAFGIHACGGAMLHRFLCLVKLGETTKAKKLLKRLKRHSGIDAENLKHLEESIKRMGPGKKTKAKVKIGTRVRCSYPMCKKVEKKVGEFAICARCEVAKYCSTKCQKKHWKMGHKNHCT